MDFSAIIDKQRLCGWLFDMSEPDGIRDRKLEAWLCEIRRSNESFLLEDLRILGIIFAALILVCILHLPRSGEEGCLKIQCPGDHPLIIIKIGKVDTIILMTQLTLSKFQSRSNETSTQK